MLEPVARADLVDDVYLRLRAAILAGQLAPGSRLVEERLAAQLDVSRAPVREALNALERDGLVAPARRKGRLVTAMSAADAWEVYSLRAVVEGLAFRIASEHVDDELLADLKGLVAEMGRAGVAGDVRRLSELDVAFHGAVSRASGHSRLLIAWESMSSQIRLLSNQVIDTLYADLAAIPKRHQLLVDLLKSGNPDQAERGVRDHIDTVANLVREALRDAPPDRPFTSLRKIPPSSQAGSGPLTPAP